MLTLRSIFLYLDRTYVVPCAGPRSLFDLGLQLLRSHIDQHPQVSRGCRFPFELMHVLAPLLSALPGKHSSRKPQAACVLRIPVSRVNAQAKGSLVCFSMHADTS